MATPAMLVTLQSVYAQARVPEQLVVYLTETLQLQTVENFVNYVVKSEYEAEWCSAAFDLRMAIDRELEALSDGEYDTRLQTMLVGEEYNEATSLLPCKMVKVSRRAAELRSNVGWI